MLLIVHTNMYIENKDYKYYVYHLYSKTNRTSEIHM